MSTNIEAVKDEVAKKKGYVNFDEACRLDAWFAKRHYDEIIELYHTRKLEGYSSELPDVEFVPHLAQHDSNEDGAEWMKKAASKLLASLHSQLEQKDKDLYHANANLEKVLVELEARDKEIETLKHCERAREEETEGWERLKVIAEENYPIEKIVGRDVSLVIEKLYNDLKSQLQKSKAEVERANSCPYKMLHR